MFFGPVNLFNYPKQWRDYRVKDISDHAKTMQQAAGRAYGHYWKSVKDLDGIDVYKVLELFEVRSHAVGHAIKKLLVAGARGAKDEKQDVNEAIAALKRHLEMLEGK